MQPSARRLTARKAPTFVASNNVAADNTLGRGFAAAVILYLQLNYRVRRSFPLQFL